MFLVIYRINYFNKLKRHKITSQRPILEPKLMYTFACKFEKNAKITIFLTLWTKRFNLKPRRIIFVNSLEAEPSCAPRACCARSSTNGEVVWNYNILIWFLLQKWSLWCVTSYIKLCFRVLKRKTIETKVKIWKYVNTIKTLCIIFRQKFKKLL